MANHVLTRGRALLLGALCAACSVQLGGDADLSTVTVLYDADERVFGPYWSVEAQFLMFLPLVTYDETGTVIPKLAQRWEHSPDARHWTFHLRPDVRWHDGIPFTAHDIAFTIQLSAHPDVLFEDIWHQLDSAVAVDDTTLTLSYSIPKDALNTWAVYYPKHVLQDLDPKAFWEWDFWSRPIGNGPYRYVRHVPKTMVELEANADYYGGKPAIERVVLKFGGASAMTELLSGSVDVLGWADRTDLPKLADDSRFRVYHHVWPGIAWRNAIYWNHSDPVFREPIVRRALTLAINRDELAQVLNTPPELSFSDLIYTPQQYRSGELPVPRHDLNEAVSLLDRANWRDHDGDGIREYDGTPLEFTALVADAGEKLDAAVFVQAELRRIGVRMEVQPLAIPILRQRLRGGDFQAAFIEHWNHVDSHLQWFGTASPLGYDNPALAELLARAKRTVGPDRLGAIYREAWPILLADPPIAFLGPRLQSYVVDRRIRGLTSPFHGDPIQFMEGLWIENGSRDN